MVAAKLANLPAHRSADKSADSMVSYSRQVSEVLVDALRRGGGGTVIPRGFFYPHGARRYCSAPLYLTARL